jgi:hypothetical protein
MSEKNRNALLAPEALMSMLMCALVVSAQRPSHGSAPYPPSKSETGRRFERV